MELDLYIMVINSVLKFGQCKFSYPEETKSGTDRRMQRRTERQTDGKTDGQTCFTLNAPLPAAGHKNMLI